MGGAGEMARKVKGVGTGKGRGRGSEERRWDGGRGLEQAADRPRAAKGEFAEWRKGPDVLDYGAVAAVNRRQRRCRIALRAV